MFTRFQIWYSGGGRRFAFGVKFPSGQHVISLEDSNEIRTYDSVEAFENAFDFKRGVTVLEWANDGWPMKIESENER